MPIYTHQVSLPHRCGYTVNYFYSIRCTTEIPESSRITTEAICELDATSTAESNELKRAKNCSVDSTTESLTIGIGEQLMNGVEKTVTKSVKFE